ncbi:MAG: cytochrome c [Alphaproteobacteria bacterium]|nr:cytochrome c [Alphaproteobacteria bacterium]
MRLNRKTGLFALAAAAIFGAATTAAFAQADVVTERRNVMRAKLAEFRAVRDVLAGSGAVNDLAARGNRLAELGERLPGLVPEGTAVGSRAGETRAMPAIWQNMADFRAQSASFSAASRALAQAASGGDRAASQAAFNRVSATCDSCHNAYRQPR